MNTRTTGGEGVILIVDDNATNLGVLFDYLKNATFRVLVAQHGKAALELLQEARPDLILLDVLMPEMDGFETCKHLKENPATRDIPVIFMTALTETVDKVRGFELGAVDYVTKPLQHEEVLARVNTHLTLGRLKQHLIRKNEELAAVNRNLAHLVQEKTRQLVQQEKTATIGRMIQGIVHNMKTPLAVIANSNLVITKKIEKLSAGLSSTPEPEIAELLNSIAQDSALVEKAHGQIMQIVNNLMLKSRMDQSADAKPVNLNSLLKQEFDFLNADPQFKHKTEKELQLDERLPELPLVYSDIAQVVENLINNALDAMWQSENRRLGVRTRQDSSHVYID
ncbi:MAG: response regulator, partial [Calditrichaeota bacterium]|nr:response regulator [Calditrichota bacterium]